MRLNLWVQCWKWKLQPYRRPKVWTQALATRMELVRIWLDMSTKVKRSIMRLTILLNSFTIPINMNITSFKNKRKKKSSQSIVNFFVKTSRDSLNSEGSNDFYFTYCLFNYFICNWFAKIVVIINLNNNSKRIKNLLIEGGQYF